MTNTSPGYDPPLLGLRVLDLVSGPMQAAGRLLLDLGASVTRVELPWVTDDEGFGPVVEGVAVGSAITARGAGRVRADLSAAEGREAWERLLADSDILLENTAPGTAAEAALDVAAIRRANPALVVLSVSDFGRGNDFSAWQATTPVFHALTGSLSRSGIPDRDPLIPPGELPYDVAGAQAVFQVLSLYLDRLGTGAGNRIDFSVLDGAMQTLDPAYGMTGSAAAGVPLSQAPRGRPEMRHQYPIIACKDGYARICVLAKRQWRGMFEWMGSPEEFADPSYDDLFTRFGSPTLIPAITRFFADKTRAELEDQGQRHGVPTAAVLTLAEALTTEQVLARGFLRDAELAPGLVAPVPAGMIEIDGARAELAEAPRAAERVTRTRAAAVGEGERPGTGLPLAGLRVLDLGVIVVGGDTGRILGDLGADVIKVENSAFPDGARASQGPTSMKPGFAAGHRNKRGIGINLRDPEGVGLARELVRLSDIVLTNFKPGVSSSLGFDYDSLKDINPGVVVVDSSAFGPTGPWAKRLGYGPLVRAAAGLTDQWTYPGEPGSFSDASTVYPDHVCARIGALGALALLVRRERTARGGTVSVAQSEVMLSHFAPRIAADELTARGHAPAGPEHDAPWGVFPAAGDDDWVAVTVRSDADWTALCGVIDRPDLLADTALANPAGRDAQRERVDAAVAEWTARHSPSVAMSRLQAAGVPAGAMLRAAEMPGWDYYRQRRSFREEIHPHASDQFAGQAFVLENTQIHADGIADPPLVQAPLLGEQTRQIATELLDLGDAQVDDLVSRGILEIVTASAAD